MHNVVCSPKGQTSNFRFFYDLGKCIICCSLLEMATSSFDNFIVGWGYPHQLHPNHLPTHGDIVDHYFFLEMIIRPVLSIFKEMCRSVKSLWSDRGSHPIDTTAVEKTVQMLLKNISSFKKTVSWKSKRAKFPKVSDLFEIGACICIRSGNSKKLVMTQRCSCKCQLSDEVVQFIQDQGG